jgi:predicted lactoylglutathione lyase
MIYSNSKVTTVNPGILFVNFNSARKAGATQIGQTQNQPWGYSVNFVDPDGHQWEIIYFHTS